MNSNTPQPLANKLLAVSLAVLLGATYSPYAAAEQAATATETAEHINFPGWENPFMGHIAYYSGQLLVQHLQAAQQALADGKVKEAKKALDAARALAAGLRDMMPFTVVVDQINDTKGDLLASDSAIMVGDLVPIYKSLEQMALYAPQLAKSSSDKLKEVEAKARTGDKQAALNKLDETAKAITDTTVYMPVLYVSAQIDSARQALKTDKPDIKTVQADISHALDSLTTTGAGAIFAKVKPDNL